jgi:hypothetical protein
MTDLDDLFRRALDGAAIEKMGARVGADRARTTKATQASAAVLFEALRNNARKPGGDRALFEALERDHDGSILDRTDEVVAGESDADGLGILRHVLGENQDQAASAIGQFAGMDKGKALQLLIMLAPLIMGLLGKMKNQGQVESPRSLPKVLERDRRTAPGGAEGPPDLGGILGDILRGKGTGQAPAGKGCLGLLGPLLGGLGRR